eukprot:scaffold7080_cov302-Pinguiococcus_pyrenoidosus.AAC.4
MAYASSATSRCTSPASSATATDACAPAPSSSVAATTAVAAADKQQTFLAGMWGQVCLFGGALGKGCRRGRKECIDWEGLGGAHAPLRFSCWIQAAQLLDGVARPQHKSPAGGGATEEWPVLLGKSSRERDVRQLLTSDLAVNFLEAAATSHGDGARHACEIARAGLVRCAPDAAARRKSERKESKEGLGPCACFWSTAVLTCSCHALNLNLLVAPSAY